MAKDSHMESHFDIAVVGMAGRFPGAPNIARFWENLKSGVESIHFFSFQELQAAGVPAGKLETPGYVTARGLLEDVEHFDAAFFGYTPGQATLMDPQLRLFHECVWTALEDAGYDPYDPPARNGVIGLYAGATDHSLWQKVALFMGSRNGMGGLVSSQLGDKDHLSTRIAHRLNLKGPGLTLSTQCSTSLAAVHLACQGLLAGECDMALAGGVSVTLPAKSGYLYQEGMLYSQDGHCRAFDAGARGTVFGSGAAAVVLKRMPDALGDRDHIDALIKASAVNNDGMDKISYAAPGVEGQARVIRAALRLARLEPENIGYVETHGTGTLLGDAIEIEALKLAFNTPKKGFCRIGSVKTNVGHLDCVAGVTGLVKTVLMLKHRLIPPSLHFETPNPNIDLESSPFLVNTGLQQWPVGEYPRRAGVSSFGIGGTNVHVILEEAPVVPRQGEGPPQLIVLSAQTPSALERMTRNLVDYFKENPGINLTDAAYTLQVGRRAFPYRRMAVCPDLSGAVDAFTASDPEKVQTGQAAENQQDAPVVFMFSGQGSQYVNMGWGVYQTVPLFRQEMERCFEILAGLVDFDIEGILYPGERDDGEGGLLNQTEVAQPLLFAFEYALTKLLMNWGIRPDAMIGHSIGEYVAAHLAGVFSLEDALQLVVLRGRLMQSMPTGSMVSVPLPEEELSARLDEELSLAAVNAPGTCVVSGPAEAVDRFIEGLDRQGIEGRRLHTSHAFHSPMMDPILREFEEGVGKVQLNRPQVPYISNLTGGWITPGEVANPNYWSRHLRETVRFADGIAELLKKKPTVFLEVGPGQSLSAFVRKRTDRQPTQMVLNLVRHPRQHAEDYSYLLAQLGRFWLYGKSVNWPALHGGTERYRLPLPTYPFEGRCYRFDEKQLDLEAVKSPQVASSAQRKDISHWYYIPSWKRSFLDANTASTGRAAESMETRWLLFLDGCGLGERLAERLAGQGHEVVKVAAGDSFVGMGDCEFRIDPGRPHDYDALLDRLQAAKKMPARVVHLWSLRRDFGSPFTAEAVEKNGEKEFYSMLYLMQAVGKKQFSREIHLAAVTNNMQEVVGGESLCPASATLVGLMRTIPREYFHVRCKSIDIDLSDPAFLEDGGLVDQLCLELSVDFNGEVIAYRRGFRWLQVFEPITMAGLGKETMPLRRQGVYLVTGGLGGIGLVLAGYLARRVRARLILTGSSPLPSPPQWNAWLDTHEKNDGTSQKIRKIRELEALGARVLTFSADVGSEEGMRQVVRRAEEKFGPINGVIHAAGIADRAGIIQRRRLPDTEAVFHPKIRGTLVLDAVLKDTKLDFWVLCSSTSSIAAPIGEAGYTAANAFLDAYATYKSSVDRTWTLSINWDAWQEVGMAVAAARKFQPAPGGGGAHSLLKDAIRPAEGVEVFRRVLNSRLPQVVVSTRDLTALLRELEKPKPPSGKGLEAEPAPSPLYRRPDLSTEYADPRHRLEKTIVDIWRQVLGIEKIGIYDNFFDLGATSLEILQVGRRLEQELNKSIPVDILFEYSSTAALAGYFNHETQGDAASGTKLERAADRRQRTFRQLRVKKDERPGY
jgi:acyl transferase domain-containing protein/acyl carrier protein